jgi:hypothetical protein
MSAIVVAKRVAQLGPQARGAVRVVVLTHRNDPAARSGAMRGMTAREFVLHAALW